MPTAPPLSRILSPFLGGTRKGPPEGPSPNVDRAAVKNLSVKSSHYILQYRYLFYRYCKYSKNFFTASEAVFLSRRARAVSR